MSRFCENANESSSSVGGNGEFLAYLRKDTHCFLELVGYSAVMRRVQAIAGKIF